MTMPTIPMSGTGLDYTHKESMTPCPVRMTNADRIQAMTKENDLKIWCAGCAFLREPEECEECRDGFELGSMPTHWTPCGQDKTPKTNADRIRAMSDEEMMEYMYHNCHCPPELDELPSCPYRKKNRVQTKDCRTCWLDWLKQEVEQDEP